MLIKWFTHFNEWISIPSSAIFLGRVWKRFVLILLYYLTQFSSEAIQFWACFCWGLCDYWFNLFANRLFRCFTFLKSVLVLWNPFHLGVLAFSCLLFVSTVIFYPRWQWCFHLAFNVFKECPTYSCFSVLKKFTRRKNKGDLHVSALWEIHRQDETDKHNSLRIRSASSGTRYWHLELGCHL